MTKEELIELKKNLREKLSKLDSNEKRERDLYLQGLATGEIQGPPVGYSSIDKPWLKYYPKEGIGAEVPNVSAYNFIYDKRKDNPNLVVFDYLGKKITCKELFEKIEQTAKALKSIGVKEGDYVTLAMPTSPEMVYTFYALNRIGAVSNCIDPRLKEDGFIKNIKSTNSKVIITLDMCLPVIDNVSDELGLQNVITVSPLESAPLPLKLLGKLKEKKTKSSNVIDWKHFIKNGNNYSGEIDVPFVKDTPVTVVHTGGTTGDPKGVLLTNENFNNMALTQEISKYDFKEEDTFLTFLPPFIAYCLVNAIHDPLYLGFENILIPMFDPKDFPKLMKRYKPNHVLSGPILWDFFIKDSDIDKEDLSYLKSPISGGDVLNPELERQINSFFKSHGCKYNIIQGYGMTEVSAAAIYSKPEAYKLSSVGIPYIKNNIAIVDPETSNELSYGEEGEICISTPTMMSQYLNNDEETAKIIEQMADGDRWIHTGDLGRIDKDGNLFVVGRMKRMIVRNGNKIFPSTIEERILQTGFVDECAVVQMNNSEDRHVPVAHIVLKQDMIGNEEEAVEAIEKIVSENLPSFNVPYKYIFRKELPLTKINKIDFKKLEAESEQYEEIDEKIVRFEYEDLLVGKKSF